MPAANVRKLKDVLGLARLAYGILRDGSSDKARPIELDDCGNLNIVKGDNEQISTGILQADTNIKATAGLVYWITISDSGALTVELNDSTNNTGRDEWGVEFYGQSGVYLHAEFNPPLKFKTGIYLDVSTASCKVVVGYK